MNHRLLTIGVACALVSACGDDPVASAADPPELPAVPVAAAGLEVIRDLMADEVMHGLVDEVADAALAAQLRTDLNAVGNAAEGDGATLDATLTDLQAKDRWPDDDASIDVGDALVLTIIELALDHVAWVLAGPDAASPSAVTEQSQTDRPTTHSNPDIPRPER